MRDEPRAVTTFCPQCGQPIIWSVQPFPGGNQLEVSAWVCFCPLTQEEWAEIGNEAAEALQAQRDEER